MTALISKENDIRISSVEIANMTGKRHSDVLRDIRNQLKELKIGESNFASTYKDAQSKDRKCFLLDKKQSLVLGSGYNVKLRSKIIDRWMELEEQNQPKIPQNKLEWMQLAIDQEKQLIEQQATLTEQAPKVEFYDDVTGSTDTVDMGKVAKVLNMGIGRNKLFEFLRDHKILQSKNEPYQKYVDIGYFRIVESKYNKPDGSAHISLKTVVYQKGMGFIRNFLNKEL